MKLLAPEYVWKLEPYVPGETIPNLIKLASNENPFGPSPKAIQEAREVLIQAHLYPPFERMDLKNRIAEVHTEHGIQLDQIVLGPGSTELITLLVRTLVSPGEAVLNAWPSFLMYSLAAGIMGRQEIRVPLTTSLEYDVEALVVALKRHSHVKLLFLANPNNPTGTYVNASSLEHLIAHMPEDVILVLDEAYFEYTRAHDFPQGLAWVQKRPRTVVLRTFSKAHGLAGLRIAYAVCDPRIASLLQRVKEPFNVSNIAQAAALAALEDHEHLKRSIENNNTEIERLSVGLAGLGFKVTPSQGNFVLAHFPDAKKAHQAMIKGGVVTRPVGNYDLPHALRITVGKPTENDVLLRALYSLDMS